jgi:hypothetical protein
LGLIVVNRRNQVDTVKLPLSLDIHTHRVLGELVIRGLFGKNRAEVASAIISRWLWDNYEQIEKHGVRLSGAPKPRKGE